MLGKNNFKERLRRMEEQNKKERFSIRKLSIGAASVLIGFAFMGMEAQTVQADQVTPSVKQEVKAASDHATVKIDKPVASAPAAEQIATPKTGEASKQTASDQSTVVAKTVVKNDNSEQNKKSQAVNKNDAKKVQTGAQDQTAKNDSAATEPNKQNSTTAETHEAQKVTGQTTQADQSQNRTSNRESTTNDQHNANSGNVELAKNDQVRDQNRQVTDKTTDVENAVSQLQKAMDQATVLANKTNLNKNLTVEQKSQLQQIDEIVSSGQALTASLRSNPENSDNRGNGNSVNGQTLNVSRLSKMTHNLNGLMTRVSAIENVDTADTKYADSWDKFVTAFEDTNVKTIYLTKDISADEITRSVTNSSNVQRDITIDGQNHFLTIHSTSGTSAFNFSNTITPNITFKDITLKGRVNGSRNGKKNDIFSTKYYFGTSNTRPTFTFENNVKLDHIVFAPMYAYQRPLGIIECPNFVIDGNVSVNDEFDHTDLHVISNVTGINIVCVFGKSNSFSLTEEGKLTGKNISIYADNISIKGDIDAQNVNFVGNQLNIENNARVDIDDTDNTINSNFKPLVFSSSPSLTGIGGTSLSGLGGMNVNISGNAAVNLKVSQAGLLSVRGQMSTIKTAGNSTLAVESDSPLIRGTSLRWSSSNLLNGTNNSLIKLTDTSSSGNIILVSMNGYINGSRNSVISATNMIIQSEHGHLAFGTSDYYVSGDKIEITSVGEKPYVFHHTYGSGLIRNMTVDQSGAFGDYDETNKDNINTRGLADHLYKYGTQYEYNQLVGAGQVKRIAWGDRAEIIVPTTDAGITNAHDLTQNAHYNQLSSLSSQKGIDNDYYKNYFNPTQTVTFANNAKPKVKWVNGIIKRDSVNGSYKYDDSSAGVIDPETGKLRQNSHDIDDNDIGNATIEITYADGTKDYVPVTIDIKKAIAKPGSVTTPAAANSAINPIYPTDSSQTDGVKNPTAAAAASVIDGTDISQWNPSYEFVDDSGNGISSFPTDSDHVFASPTDPDHYKVIKTNVKVNYKNSDGTDDGYQIIPVFIRVKKTLADQYSNDVNAKNNFKVLDGSQTSLQNDAKAALDITIPGTAPQPTATWTVNPTEQTDGSYKGTVKVVFTDTDGSTSSLTRDVTYHVIAKATAKTDHDAITFNEDGTNVHTPSISIKNGSNEGKDLLSWGDSTEPTGQSYSVTGLQYQADNSHLLRPTDSEHTQTASVKVQLADDNTYTGGQSDVQTVDGHKVYTVGVSLNIPSDSANHTPGTVNPGQHPVDPDNPNGGQFYVDDHNNVYVHVNGTIPAVDQIVQVKDHDGHVVASGASTYTISGWTAPSTSAENTNPAYSEAAGQLEHLTINYHDGTSATLDVHVKVIGGTGADLTHTVYGGHTSPAAKDQISNNSDLAAKFGSHITYSWYKDAAGQTAMNNSDFNTPTTAGSANNAWVKIDWGDGTSQMVGLKLNLLSDRDTYHPTPRPIPVTPGENPSDITNPTPAEPTPGVDHNSVPSGSHTILDPSQPAPDTTTPGTHPVHVIVVYPDGSQSDPIETNIVVPDENTPSYEDTSVGETISPVIIFRDNHDKAIKTLTDKISGYEGSTIPLETLKKLIAEEMPEGYALDMDLEQAWREGKFVITVNHPIYIKIVKVRRQLVLFVDKRGRIVKRAYVLIKESQKLSNEVVKSLTGKDMPKGYKMNGYKKVANHIDVLVSGKKTKPTSHGKLVLYVRKDGKIIKRAYVTLVANKFSKRNAKMHLPKGYKMSGHTHINRHNDVWIVKKSHK